MLEEALYMRITGFSAQGRHEQSLADLAIARLGYSRTFLHAASCFEMARIQPSEFDPLLVGQPGWQQLQFTQ